VLRKSFAPTRAALHTRIRRHAPTSPRCAATRAHTSGRPVARSTAQLASSWAAVVVVVGGSMVRVCVLGVGGGGAPKNIWIKLCRCCQELAKKKEKATTPRFPVQAEFSFDP
jgi:hypothetical protein